MTLGASVETVVKLFASYVALGVETIAVLICGCGALEAAAKTLGPLRGRKATPGFRKRIWVDFGMWILLALQFALAADIVRSVISPGFREIAQLGAIAGIRTFLNYFLERDLEWLERASDDERPAGS